MNTTRVDSGPIYTIEDYYSVASLSVGFCLIAIIICIVLLLLIWRTKPRLHTTHHLLICNTCIASIIYSIVTINNYTFLLFIRWDRSNTSCRWRAYFTYVGITGEMYSYLIQGISRFFFSVLSSKYRWLTTFQTHYILITIQWLTVFLITSSSVLTKDITFYPEKLCLIPLKNTLHAVCAIFAYYVIPLLTTTVIYIYIFYQVKQSKKNATMTVNSVNGQKRDLKVLRNILLLIGIYLVGGFPSIIFFLTPTKYPYLINLVTQSATVAIGKLCIIILDREIRLVIKNILCRTTSIRPLNTTFPRGKIQQHQRNAEQTNVQHLQTYAQSQF